MNNEENLFSPEQQKIENKKAQAAHALAAALASPNRKPPPNQKGRAFSPAKSPATWEAVRNDFVCGICASVKAAALKHNVNWRTAQRRSWNEHWNQLRAERANRVRENLIPPSAKLPSAPAPINAQALSADWLLDKRVQHIVTNLDAVTKQLERLSKFADALQTLEQARMAASTLNELVRLQRTLLGLDSTKQNGKAFTNRSRVILQPGEPDA